MSAFWNFHITFGEGFITYRTFTILFYCEEVRNKLNHEFFETEAFLESLKENIFDIFGDDFDFKLETFQYKNILDENWCGNVYINNVCFIYADKRDIQKKLVKKVQYLDYISDKYDILYVYGFFFSLLFIIAE